MRRDKNLRLASSMIGVHMLPSNHASFSRLAGSGLGEKTSSALGRSENKINICMA